MRDEAALIAIHAAFSDPVIWKRADDEQSLDAVLFYEDGGLPYSDGGSVNRRGYEILKSALPIEPENGDLIIDGPTWRVIEAIDYAEAAAWRVMVEVA